MANRRIIRPVGKAQAEAPRKRLRRIRDDAKTVKPAANLVPPHAAPVVGFANDPDSGSYRSPSVRNTVNVNTIYGIPFLLHQYPDGRIAGIFGTEELRVENIRSELVHWHRLEGRFSVPVEAIRTALLEAIGSGVELGIRQVIGAPGRSPPRRNRYQIPEIENDYYTTVTEVCLLRDQNVRHIYPTGRSMMDNPDLPSDIILYGLLPETPLIDRQNIRVSSLELVPQTTITRVNSTEVTQRIFDVAVRTGTRISTMNDSCQPGRYSFANPEALTSLTQFFNYLLNLENEHTERDGNFMRNAQSEIGPERDTVSFGFQYLHSVDVALTYRNDTLRKIMQCI